MPIAASHIDMHRFYKLVACTLGLCAFAPAQRDLRATLTANNTSAVHGLQQSGVPDPGNVSKLSLHTMLPASSHTRILVRYMPWFGERQHVDIGYREDDPSQVHRQVQDMMSRGIDGAIVAWYGPDDKHKDDVTRTLLREAERTGGRFQVGISVDVGAFEQCRKRGCDTTREMSSLLNYVARNFFSSPAYLRYNNRPVLTSFGLEKLNIDWNAVKQNAPQNMVVLFRNSGGFNTPGSDGAFAWIAPEAAKASDPEALVYLQNFYKVARQHTGMIAMGSAYVGFNDGGASWGKGRHIDQDCGKTWLSTFALANQYIKGGGSLPMLIIPTWNDYEEGTAIEPGIDNCVRIDAKADGNQVRWNVQGSKDTIANFLIYSSTSPDQPIATLSRDEHSWRAVRELRKGTKFYVVAQGVPSVKNQVSNAVELAED